MNCHVEIQRRELVNVSTFIPGSTGLCGQITTGVDILVLNDQYKKDVIIITIIIILKCHTDQMQVIIPSSNALSLV